MVQRFAEEAPERVRLPRLSLNYLKQHCPLPPIDVNLIKENEPGTVSFNGGSLVLHPSSWPWTRVLRALDEQRLQTDKADLMWSPLGFDEPPPIEALEGFEEVLLLLDGNSSLQLLQGRLNRWLLKRVHNGETEMPITVSLYVDGDTRCEPKDFIKTYTRNLLYPVLHELMELRKISDDVLDDARELLVQLSENEVSANAQAQDMRLVAHVLYRSIVNALVRFVSKAALRFGEHYDLLNDKSRSVLERIRSNPENENIEELLGELADSLRELDQYSSLQVKVIRMVPTLIDFVNRLHEVDKSKLVPLYCRLCEQLLTLKPFDDVSELGGLLKVGLVLADCKEEIAMVMRTFMPAYAEMETGETTIQAMQPNPLLTGLAAGQNETTEEPRRRTSEMGMDAERSLKSFSEGSEAGNDGQELDRLTMSAILVSTTGTEMRCSAFRDLVTEEGEREIEFSCDAKGKRLVFDNFHCRTSMKSSNRSIFVTNPKYQKLPGMQLQLFGKIGAYRPKSYRSLRGWVTAKSKGLSLDYGVGSVQLKLDNEEDRDRLMRILPKRA